MFTVNLSAGAVFGLGVGAGLILAMVVLVVASYAMTKKKK